MIDLVDKNKDYKLDQEEFTELLRPELVPFSKGLNIFSYPKQIIYDNVLDC